jgi:hypothetical protein
MKALRFLVVSISVCSLSIAASGIIPSAVWSKEPLKMKPVQSDCNWKCNEKKQECECHGKNCQTCAGTTAKSMGKDFFVIGLQTCSTSCSWECSGSIDGQCVEWEKNCKTICRGR